MPTLRISFDHVSLAQLAVLMLETWCKSVVLLTVAGGFCWYARKAAAALRHWVWFLAMASLVGLPWLPFTLPIWPRAIWAVSADTSSGNQVTFVIGLARGPGFRPANTAQKPQDNSPVSSAEKKGQKSPWLTARCDTSWLLAIPVLWVAGSFMVLAMAGMSRFHLRRLCRNAAVAVGREWDDLMRELGLELGLRRPVRLMIFNGPVMPMTWGWLQPTVLLPAEASRWSEERRRIVLWHELAHVKRWDCLQQTIAYAVCVVYWPNPMVWLAVSWMRIERERACDDLLINRGCKASAYANHLVEIASRFRSRPLATGIAMARSSGLAQRVTAILDDRRDRRQMSRNLALLAAFAVIGLLCFISGCSSRTAQSPAISSFERSDIGKQLQRFVEEKKAQAIAGAKSEGKVMLPEFQSLFAAAAKGDWLTISNIWQDLRQRAPQYEGPGPKDSQLFGTAWQTVLETWGAFGNIALGGDRLVAFAQDAVAAIPSGSIYFGGTDPGRCVITALQKSHVQADPFFTLTQNALADNSYLQYVRAMYGQRIYLPTDEDSQKCFDEYVSEAEQRLARNQLKPGENVERVDGKFQVSGQPAVMAINGLLTRTIFERNTNCEFFIEESFPLDWMYPYLSPCGPIMKINRQPLPELEPETVRRDHEYWTRALEPLIGKWLAYDTPLPRVIAFAEKSGAEVQHRQHSGASDYPEKWSSKLRCAIGGVYVWRYRQATDPAAKQRMFKEADFAYRQAFAACPYSPEVVFAYVNLLMGADRLSDASLVAVTASKLAPRDMTFRNLVQQIEQARNAARR
jgi:beta-lactamase regulating signal transducer with metallopeptidase domain